MRLRSVQLNDGLEALGKRVGISRRRYQGHVFNLSAIQSIRLPSGLKRIEEYTFGFCQNLRSVKIPSGTEYIGRDCF